VRVGSAAGAGSATRYFGTSGSAFGGTPKHGSPPPRPGPSFDDRKEADVGKRAWLRFVLAGVIALAGCAGDGAPERDEDDDDLNGEDSAVQVTFESHCSEAVTVYATDASGSS